MQKIIHLDTMEGLPEKFIKKLGKHDDKFKSYSSLEEVVETDDEIIGIIESINEYCMSNWIKGYHYTRADLDTIQSEGLICRNSQQIHEAFLSKYSSRFDPEELVLMKECWSEFPKWSRMSSRDHRIFFNVTTNAQCCGGADELLGIYGGEQIYFPLLQHEGIIQKLRQIGAPQLVMFRTSGKKAEAIGLHNGWGKIACSSYHQMVNPQSSILDADCIVKDAIPAKDILTIKYL